MARQIKSAVFGPPARKDTAGRDQKREPAGSAPRHRNSRGTPQEGGWGTPHRRARTDRDRPQGGNGRTDRGAGTDGSATGERATKSRPGAKSPTDKTGAGAIRIPDDARPQTIRKDTLLLEFQDHDRFRIGIAALAGCKLHAPQFVSDSIAVDLHATDNGKSVLEGDLPVVALRDCRNPPPNPGRSDPDRRRT